MFSHLTPRMWIARLSVVALAMAAAIPSDAAFAQTVRVRGGATVRVGTQTTIRTAGTFDFGDAAETSRIEEMGGGYVHAGLLEATRTIPASSTTEPAGLGFALTVDSTYTPLVARRHESVIAKGRAGIKRSYAATPYAGSRSNVAVLFKYADAELDLNNDGNPDFIEANLSLFMYYDNGETAPKWIQIATSGDSGQNLLTASGLASVAPRWTAATRFTGLELIAALRGEVEASGLRSGQAKTLKSKLNQASNFLVEGNTEGAVTQLVSFKDQVGTLANSGALSAASAESLVLEAHSAIDEMRRTDASGAISDRLASSTASDEAEAMEISHSAAEAAEIAPNAFALQPAYPNPFNPSTMISFALPEATEIRLAVYDVLGRQVALLVDGVETAGLHTIQFDANQLPSGAYFVHMNAGQFSQTQRITLVR